MLRSTEKWSGAAGFGAAGIGSRSGTEGSETSEHEYPETDDPTDGPRTGDKVGSPARKFKPHTPGTKAAKSGRKQDIEAAREVRSSIEALQAVANAAAERSAIVLLNQPNMRDMEDVKLFMRTKVRQMLKAAGIPLGPEPAKSRTPPTVSVRPTHTWADLDLLLMGVVALGSNWVPILGMETGL